jgi:hypothetical protein
VVIEGAAGTVSVAVPDLLESAIEVAVTVIVCDDEVAAGAVYVTEEVVSFDSDPPPLTVHLTPPLFLSWVTVAVRVTVSVPSTTEAEAVTETDGVEPLPPHAERKIATTRTVAHKPRRLLSIASSNRRKTRSRAKETRWRAVPREPSANGPGLNQREPPSGPSGTSKSV